MSFIRPVQPSNDSFSQWGNSVVTSTEQQRISLNSGDFFTIDSDDGRFLSLNTEQKYPSNYPIYQGEWSPYSSYNIGDIVRVLPGVNYIGYPNQNNTDSMSLHWMGNGPTLGSAPDESSIVLGPTLNGTITVPNSVLGISGNGVTGFDFLMGYYVPIPGTYICVAPVPGLVNQVSLMISNPSLGTPFLGTLSKNLNNGLLANVYYVRLFDINYFPTWPEIPNIPYIDPNALYNAYGRYWELISLLPNQTFNCSPQGNIAQITDSQLWPSGSANYTGSLNLLMH